jgi:ATP-dependent Lhr-like helicase
MPTANPDAPEVPSQAFEMLHPAVQRWIWMQNWSQLRDIQERSIPILLEDSRDLVIAASTASGKTEAAFLPIVSRIGFADLPPCAGFQAIYISPLRALINDQFARIESLCEEMSIPVVKWHGDVPAAVKSKARQCPGGILLTTPESVEAMLCRRGGEARRMFASLRHIVVDELHAFIDVPRGRQLQSLMNRLEVASGHTVARVGLSATLADMKVAGDFLNPGRPDGVTILKSESGTGNLMLQLRGYVEPPMVRAAKGSDGDDSEKVTDLAIAKHVFETMRGHRGLIFAGSRNAVEMMTVRLNTHCERLAVPEEFFPHHGSLSREIREESERRLKDETRPGSIVSTTTMELGLDVGLIDQVAQTDLAHTVSGMRQRIGRSGRREGQPSVMRLYVAEPALTSRTHPLEALRARTVQMIAMTNLMLRRWNEPSVPGRLHLSTLVHQILALVIQHGGLTAAQGWVRLMESGVFPNVSVDLYRAVLRRMAHPDVALLEQAPDGTLLPGRVGEAIAASYEFFAVFMTDKEFKVVTDRGISLGNIPISNPVVVDQLMILAGRRWQVIDIDPKRHEIIVTRASGGTPPRFPGAPGAPADEVVAEMKRVFLDTAEPAFLDEAACELLTEGRATFQHLGLAKATVCAAGDQLLLFPWVGGRTQNALLLALMQHGIPSSPLGLAIGAPVAEQQRLRHVLHAIASAPPPDPVSLAALVPDKMRDKFDVFLGEELLRQDWASENIDAARIPALAAFVLQGMPEALQDD